MSAALPSFSLAGRRAIVTGASRGIGRCLAEALAGAGAAVGLCARSETDLEEAAVAIRAAGGVAHSTFIDLRDTLSITRAVDTLAEAMGGVDILVNNAGFENICPALEVTEDIWDAIIDTNLRGQFFCAQAAARHMLAIGGGSIINMGSVASAIGIATAVPYVSSKHGLLGMTRALATEWAPLGIRVNAIGPGYYRTAMTEVFYQDDVWRRTMLPKIPQGRFGDLEDLCGACVFLASDAAAYIAGQILFVDGGYLSAL